MNHAEMQFLTTEFPYKKQYDNFIGGQWVKPVGGEYFDNISPITGEPFTSIPRSREADVELAETLLEGGVRRQDRRRRDPRKRPHEWNLRDAGRQAALGNTYIRTAAQHICRNTHRHLGRCHRDRLGSLQKIV